MNQNRISDFYQYLEEWSQDLELLRQNRLLDESAFIRFARDRGLAVSGVVIGDSGDLHKRGWLTSDGTDHNGGPLFHPFQMYPLYQTLQACKLNIAASASLQRDSMLGFVEKVLASMPSVSQLGNVARERNQVVDLAILLEPVYWPHITGHRLRPIDLSENDYKELLDQYRQKTVNLVGTLDPNLWRNMHERLRIHAAWMDENDTLYLLLRLATWHQREQLKGCISGALWMRHIAEVIRRAFEEVYAERWPEEDRAFVLWSPGDRTRVLGSERPLDAALQSKPYLAWEYGLFTGSVVRWYVEGETEYYAILHIRPEPSKVGIELVNLRGNIASGRDNAALKLQDWLTEDKALRRFSMISFDCDVLANVKAIRRQVELQNVVGLIAAHNPDFEFANFAIQELAEVAARIDEAHGVSGDAVRNADWTGVGKKRVFEERYKAVSVRLPQGLKGEEWGRALAAYAVQHPNRSDNGSKRPFWHEINAALRIRIVQYDVQKERFGFDRDTFEQIDL